MAVTEALYTGNGSTTLFSFSFPYLEQTDVKVTLNGTLTTAFTFASSSTIQFNTAPSAGVAIRIYRETDVNTTAATFYSGSSIRSTDLNNNFNQSLYVSQEVVNDVDTAVSQIAGAVTTANTANANATTALSTANTANSTANSAAGVASTATTTANSALSTANTAISTANTSLSQSTAAINAVAAAVPYSPVTDLTALGALSPTNGTYYELNNSTGAESSSLITGVPVGLTGASDLTFRLRYDNPPGKFAFLGYFATDPNTRYAVKSTESVASSAQTTANAALSRAGGTMTGNIVFAGTQTFPSPTIPSASTTVAGIVQLSTSTSSTSTTLASTPSATKSAYDLANTANTTANAALPKAGGTVTGNIDNTATGYLDLPAGTTAQRPGTPSSGMIRYNTDLAQFEGYGTAWDSWTINQGSLVATSGQTSLDISGIPSSAKRIIVMLNNISTNGTSPVGIRVVVGGTPVTSGYVGTGGGTLLSQGFTDSVNNAAAIRSGHLMLTKMSSTIWVASGLMARSDTSGLNTIAGYVTVAGAITGITVTTVVGTETFDAGGNVTLTYES